MTTIEVASLAFKLLEKNEFDEKDVTNLQTRVSKLDRIESHLYEYAILPKLLDAFNCVENLSKDECRAIHILDFIRIFTEKSYITNEKAYKSVVIVLLNKIYDPVKNVVLNVGERVLISVLNCLEALARRMEGETVERFYRKENATVLGQMIFISLENMQKEQNFELRLSSINCLMSILQVHNEFDTNDIVLRSQIADLLFTMTPRIFTIVMKIVESDARTPQRIRAQAINALGRILCLIFEDQDMDFKLDEITHADFLTLTCPIDTNQSEIKAIEDKPRQESFVRTTEWMTGTIQKLTPMLTRLPTLLSPDFGPFVHDELLKMSRLIIHKCYKNFHNTILTFYEIFLVLNDSKADQLVLNQKHQTRAIMEKGLAMHVRRLPRIIHRKSEAQLYTALKLLNAYINYFLDINSFIITYTDTFKQIFDALLLMLELNYPKICLDESLEWNEMSLNINFQQLPWRQHKYLSEDTLDKEFNDVIRTLQHREIFPVVTNHIFDRLEADPNASNEIICLIMRILTTSNGDNSLIQPILSEFLHDCHWYLTVRLDSCQETSLDEVHFNIIHICLVIELISVCSHHIKSNQEQYLFNILPKILEKAGTNNVLIHSAALYGLEVISKGLDMENLIQTHADFISHYIGIRLKRDDIKNCLDMTNAFLELINDYDDFRFIEGLFVTMMDLFHKSISDDSLTGALKITLILLRKLIKRKENVPEVINIDRKLGSQMIFDDWMKIVTPPEEPEYQPGDTELDFDKMKEEMEKISQEDEPEEVEPEEVTEQDDPNKFYRNLIRTLLAFISSPHLTHKLYALDIVRHCLELQEPQHKEFLPTVHLIWSSLSPRFKETNLLIVSRTFDLLLVMARMSKDFIQKRTSTDVFPYIFQFLNKSSVENVENTGSFASTLTQRYKLQQKIFSNIGEIFQYLEVHEKVLDELLNACKDFLLTNQSRNVKQSCIKLLQTLFLYDAPGVIVKFYNVPEIMKSKS